MRIAIAIVLITVGSPLGHASGALSTIREEPVTVRVHDYAHVDQSALAGAQQLVASFYASVGVRTEWMPMRGQDPRGLAEGAGDRLEDERIEDLTVVVLNRRMAARKGLPTNAIGAAPVGLRQIGRIAYVLYERVEDVAAAVAWPKKDLLAVVIAHELGHLLLPPGSHSTAGLMRGDWSVADLRRTGGPRLAFTRGQGVLMREALAQALSVQVTPSRRVLYGVIEDDGW